MHLGSGGRLDSFAPFIHLELSFVSRRVAVGTDTGKFYVAFQENEIRNR